MSRISCLSPGPPSVLRDKAPGPDTGAGLRGILVAINKSLHQSLNELTFRQHLFLSVVAFAVVAALTLAILIVTSAQVVKVFADLVVNERDAIFNSHLYGTLQRFGGATHHIVSNIR